MTFAFLRFDLRNALVPGGRILAPIAFAAVMAALVPIPAIAVATAVAVASLSASAPFLGDERGRLDVLYATLPVSRAAVVAGRYLMLVVLFLAVTVVAAAACAVTDAVRGTSFDVAALGSALAIGSLAVGLALAVQLPVFFRVGFTRARPMMYLPIVVLAGAAWLTGQVGAGDALMDLATGPVGTVAVAIAPLVGAALLVASAALATRLYRGRTLT
jgi:hypothetical protein